MAQMNPLLHQEPLLSTKFAVHMAVALTVTCRGRPHLFFRCNSSPRVAAIGSQLYCYRTTRAAADDNNLADNRGAETASINKQGVEKKSDKNFWGLLIHSR